jgi:hypothetical protein
MNWDAIKSILKLKTPFALAKLGQFRKNHPSVEGIHKQISAQPYTFLELSLKDYMDSVVVALDLKLAPKNFQ